MLAHFAAIGIVFVVVKELCIHRDLRIGYYFPAMIELWPLFQATDLVIAETVFVELAYWVAADVAVRAPAAAQTDWIGLCVPSRCRIQISIVVVIDRLLFFPVNRERRRNNRVRAAVIDHV